MADAENPARGLPDQTPPPEGPRKETAAATPAGAVSEAAAPAAKPVAPAAKHPAAKPPAEMAAEPWEDELTRALAQQFDNRIERFATYVGQNFLAADCAAVYDIVEALRDKWQFDYLVDLTAVDFPNRPKRFEVVYILYSYARNERIRLKCAVAEGERPRSVVALHATADWLEREVYDMFGIEFARHPDLRRLLLPEDWQGFPLRRDTNILAMDNQWVRENLGIESGQ